MELSGRMLGSKAYSVLFVAWCPVCPVCPDYQLRTMAQALFDRRRINGPEESISPVFVDDIADSLSPGKPRKGRAPSDIRPICE